MPKNTQNLTKSKGRKIVKEERYRKVALSDNDAIYGRVIKALGQRQFHVILPDASKRLIEVRATIPKKRSIINIDDIVVVASSGTTYEIQASMDKKTAQSLSNENKIHPDILLKGEWDPMEKKVARADEEGIEFDYEGVQPDEDVNVDAI